MKQLSFLLLLGLPITIFAQVKIDTGYKLLNSGRPITPAVSYHYLMVPDSMQVKQLSSGKICRISSYETSFLIKGELFKANDRAAYRNCLNQVVPKDKIFLGKIVLEGCGFAPPKSAVIHIQ